MSFELKYDRKHVKVAIVGASIAGCSCAYFLNELFRNQIEITIFEKSNNLNEKKFEFNGRRYFYDVEPYFNSQNLYMDQLRKICCKFILF